MDQGDGQQWLLPAEYDFDMDFNMDWTLPLEGDSTIPNQLILTFRDEVSTQPRQGDFSEIFNNPVHYYGRSDEAPSPFEEPMAISSYSAAGSTPIFANLHDDWSLPTTTNFQEYAKESFTPEFGITPFDTGASQIYEGFSAGSYKGTITLPATQPLTTKQPAGIKPVKPRLRCQHPRCNSTFPRHYELKRHVRNIHNRSFGLVCSVYGCNRTTKPFGRPDKLQEHMRKHSNAQVFLCPFDSCRKAPSTRTELESHLNSDHYKTTHQRHLADVLRSIGLRETNLSQEVSRFEGNDCCPLAFLGCTYRNGFRFDRVWSWYVHRRNHELVDCSRGYHALKSVGVQYAMGNATCPICKEKLWVDHENYLRHVAKHSKEERAEHALEIAETLSPYLTREEDMPLAHLELDQLRKEFEGLKAVTTTEAKTII